MASKPGERRLQILQTLAAMLETPRGEKVTTAALASRLDVSEAALYRHFASKAQMFEGLIGFIEETVFGLINKIMTEQKGGLSQIEAILTMLLGFATLSVAAELAGMHPVWRSATRRTTRRSFGSCLV